MYIDRNALEEYPFWGCIYRKEVADKSVPPSQWVSEQVAILVTACDIQSGSNSKSGSDGSISNGYDVYFKFDRREGIKVRSGDYFCGEMYGLPVHGEVIGVSVSQLGGCKITIKAISESVDNILGILHNGDVITYGHVIPYYAKDEA